MTGKQLPLKEQLIKPRSSSEEENGELTQLVACQTWDIRFEILGDRGIESLSSRASE